MSLKSEWLSLRNQNNKHGREWGKEGILTIGGHVS